MKKSIHDTVSKFIKPYKLKKNVVGIVLVGSYAYGTPQKNSDIDIYIILEKASYRMRGNTWINGYEIEYFINPVNQIKQYFKDEAENKSTAKMLSYGEVLYEKDSRLRKIIAEAKRVLNKKIPKLRKKEIDDFKYFLDDLAKDLEDVQENKVTTRLIAQQAIELCIKVFFRIIQEPTPKKKNLLKIVKDLDEKFYLKLKNALIEENTSEDTIALITYVEKLLGGKRQKECIAKTSLTVK